MHAADAICWSATGGGEVEEDLGVRVDEVAQQLEAMVAQDEEEEELRYRQPAQASRKEVPHLVTVFHPVTFLTHQLPCDVTSLTVGEVRDFAARRLQAVAPFDLLLNGRPIPRGSTIRAIDVGLSNGSVLVFSESPPPGFDTSPARSSSSSGSLTPTSSCSEYYHDKLLQAGADPFSATGAHYLCTALSCSTPSSAYSEVHSLLRRPRDFVDMSRDANASKVVLAFVERARPDHALDLLRVACSHIGVLGKSVTGAEILMSLLVNNDGPGTMGADGIPIIVAAMIPFVTELCNNVPGKKLVQNVVIKYQDIQKAPFYEAVEKNVVAIAPNQCGCITLQRMLDYANTQYLKHLLQEAILRFAQTLIFNPYGNYVIQHIIAKSGGTASERVAELVCSNIVKCATDKIVSNVIEKCLTTGSGRAKAMLVQAVSDSAVMGVLIKDGFGNYVIQTAVEHAPLSLLEQLRQAIVPVLDSSPYSFRIEAKLQKRLRMSHALASCPSFPLNFVPSTP